MNRAVVPVVLSGGSGTRLWPLSRELRPKQFLPLVGERTLLQETFLRARDLGGFVQPPIVVCNEDHRFIVAEQAREVGITPATIVLEPAGRNTAPAVAVAAHLALGHAEAAASKGRQHARAGDRAGSDADPLLVVLPADHVVTDVNAFVRAAHIALEAADAGHLVAFGIVPDRPETGYGYIRHGPAAPGSSGWFSIDQFVEKPALETARRYLASGEYSWNSGMFVFSARRYLQELELRAPNMAAPCRDAARGAKKDADFTRLDRSFLSCPAESIDYAVMEKTDQAAVVPLEAGWSDVGSWPALHEVLAKDEHGNVLRGDVIAEGCRNSYILSSDRLIAAVGVEDYVIVDTADAVLVMPHAAAQDVKRVVEALKASARAELRAPLKGYE